MDDLLKMFWAAPTITANMRGVVPRVAVMGAKKSENRVSPKNPNPVTPIMVGVTRAANLHPNLEKMVRPSNIMTRVTVPVADEKLPMNAEYSFGFGKACLSLDFHETSTILIHNPYEMTSMAKSRIYEEDIRNLADSFMVMRGFFVGADDDPVTASSGGGVTAFFLITLSCRYL